VSRLPSVKSRQLEKALLKLGFLKVRQKGSHVFYRHTDGRTTTIPHHPSRDIVRPLVLKILKEANLTPEEISPYL
jgi:predicted RNA binding protein YcfA (HicA-like mRNA interferase family)